jgi:predicted DNA-binding transcriptional regulator YafY
VLPEKLRVEANPQFLFALNFANTREMRAWMGELRAAMAARHKVSLTYRKAEEDAAPTVRVVEPLGLYYWGKTWTLGAWCELRRGFRTFRLDRITGVTVLTDTTYTRTPEDYIRYAEES